MLKNNIAVLALVFVLAGFAVYHNMAGANKQTMTPKEEAPKANFLAPGFTLEGLDGQVYKVGGPREKPVVVNFWASWCGPCREEAPDLKRLYDQFKDQIDFYAVNTLQGDKLEDVQKFVQTYDLRFPVLLDKEGQAADKYNLIFIPTSFLIDRNGVVREVVHVISPADWERKMKALIKK
jgi:thiol-disulfide isomerase/thioredoxin